MHKKIFLTIIFLLSGQSIFSQTITEKSKTNKYNISNYVGVAPSQSEATFYIGAVRKITDRLAIGLKGGIYNYDISLDEAFTEVFEQIYYASNANSGFYTASPVPIVKQNFTYIGSLTGEYYYKKNFAFEFSIGLKYYLQKTYAANLSWSVPYPNAPLPEGNLSPNSEIYIYEQKDIFKAYYSAGFNYVINNFEAGIFGDNIYSVGAKFGVSF